MNQYQTPPEAQETIERGTRTPADVIGQSAPEAQEIIELSSIVAMRVDMLLARARPSISRRQLVSSIVTLLVNRQAATQSSRVRPRDRVYAALSAVVESRPLAADLSLDIMYEDDVMLVINKPSGIAVHPADGMRGDEITISQALCFRYPRLQRWQRDSQYRAGIVHRLDKETSGVLLAAKDEATAEALRAQFAARLVRKRYVAAVYGRLFPPAGEALAPIARDRRHRARFTVASHGKNAHTIYKTIKSFDTYTMVKLFPITGRTHQLRVHLRSLAHPIVGDERYARNQNNALRRSHGSVPRLMLHAQRIVFDHPRGGARRVFVSPLPPVFHSALRGELLTPHE